MQHVVKIRLLSAAFVQSRGRYTNDRRRTASSSGGLGGGAAVGEDDEQQQGPRRRRGSGRRRGAVTPAKRRSGIGEVNDVEQRRGGALPDRSIPDETQQQWTRKRDFDEARRRDGLFAKKMKGVDFGVKTSIEGHGKVLNHIDFNYKAN
ncbi:hypothetical protein Scep_000977 [Stephania cephalantha]|uniref:Uncharacterized protein n=1 Tax=Stephania cephalantha TaxID=152367 RepID=A0AAP0L7B1_9MAGN